MKAKRPKLLVATSALICAAFSQALAGTRTFDVPAQSLDRAIGQFGRQADVQIIAARRDTRGKRSNVVRGSLSVDEALDRMLGGTGLTDKQTGPETYVVIPAATVQPPAAQKPTAQPPVAGPAASPGSTATVVVPGRRPELTGPRRDAHWYRAESQHFIVYTDVRREDAIFLLNQLERLRYVLRGFLRQEAEPEPPEAKTELYYLSRSQDLEVIPHPGYHDLIGLNRSCEDGTQAYAVHLYYNSTAGQPLEKRPENEGLSYIFQAYARHYLYQHSLDRKQVWFIDGFAHYFSTARFEGNQAVLGMAPQPFANLLRSSTFPSKLNYRYVLLAEQTDVQLPGMTLDTKMEYQARAWVLVHYILSSPENLKRFGVYLQAVDAGTEPVKAFETAFDMSTAKFSEVSTKLLQGLEATKATFKALPEADVSFFTLPESADKLLLWGSALKTCPSPSQGRSLLGKIRNEVPKYPDSVLAQRILSLAEAGWGDPNVAVAYLIRDGMPDDFEGLYLLGRAQLSLARKSTGEARTVALKAARQAFAKASIIDATSTPTAWYYYRTAVLLDGRPDEDAQSAALTAWLQAPEIDTYALHAGLVYAWLGRKEEALKALKTVADNPRGRELRPVAQAWMTRIQAGADEASLLAAMQADYPSPGGGLYELTRASADTVRFVRGLPPR